MKENKKCFKCNKTKKLKDFYKHPQMKDGHVNKCKECNKIDNKTSNGTQERVCIICENIFNTTLTEVKRGGGNCCSRSCWYIHFSNIVPSGEDSPNWKGDDVGMNGLHDWVKKHKGKPNKCEICKTTEAKKFEWSNISQKYKRDLSDWQRLCSKCHIKYDKEHPDSKRN